MAETSSFDGSTRVAGHWSTSKGILIWVGISRADSRMDHEKTKSMPENRPRDLVRLNKMKRASWTSDETAGRCENAARSTGQSSDKLSLGPVCQFWEVTGPVGWSMMAMGRWALGIGPGAWATSLGLCVTCLGAVRPVRDVWQVCAFAGRQGFFLNPETQRKPEKRGGFLYVLGTHANGQERREKAGIHSQWREQPRRRMQCRKWFHGSSMEGMMVGSDLMALNHGLAQFRNDAHGLSRAVHGQDPYDPGRFIGF
ncbi:hypothetical protein DY000_02006528 [Brassica cretica]|uniref:Uncharacterized protein n=1 Tax=Brassica cretica TaxID=69181 RepID=A0ABQ7CFH3_BRACR|nr:hypothetical protein DY000_02006528 [Brassica cretica]